MASYPERFWIQPSARRHQYMDVDGKIIGVVTEYLSTREFAASAYDRKLGEYAYFTDARLAVQHGCAQIDAERAAAAAKRAETQADGDATE